MRVVLISTYELGRQPFGLASPAAWLRECGAEVRCLDLAVESLDEALVRSADLIAFYVPMHTATRLAIAALSKVQELNPSAQICFYGLYAAINERVLRQLGAGTILGGEFEEGLASLVRASMGEISPPTPPVISLARQRFRLPARTDLPELVRYAHLVTSGGERRTVGYTEATRGCKHLCRHCPIVPVYNGSFRVVQRDVVLQDVRQQYERGARHITFGDPDFFNGPAHAVRIVRALHEEFPALTYDVTIKVEHLKQHESLLPTLRDTGCLFVTSAVEAVDPRVLRHLDKGHAPEDFAYVVSMFRHLGLTLNPTFVSFTPWTTLRTYLEFLHSIRGLGLIGNVAPIQYGIRLLIPNGSRLLELADIEDVVRAFDERALVHPWVHPDPRVDQLWSRVVSEIQESQRQGEDRHETFRRVWRLAHEAIADEVQACVDTCALDQAAPAATVPYLSEPWYC